MRYKEVFNNTLNLVALRSDGDDSLALLSHLSNSDGYNIMML
jgi:hypothetical protein